MGGGCAKFYAWQTMELVKGMIANDFHVDTVSFYVGTRIVEMGH
jgi:hypothetical protein